jgi:hypothetical protein
VASCCEHGNKFSGSIKWKDFQIVVSWLVTPFNLLSVKEYFAEQGLPENKDITYLGNAGIYLNGYMLL